jgi:hypothetical protein
MSKNSKQINKKWKVINDYPKYKVSTNGEVVRISDNYAMKKSLCTHYHKVSLANNNGTKRVFVHRLVAKAFIPNPKKLPCVDHIDNNKLNNNITNLRWCTRSKNTQAYHSIPKESRIVFQYDKNNKFMKEWISVKNILDNNPQYSESTILNNLTGHNKYAYGYLWRYKIPRCKKILIQPEVNEIFKPIPKFENADLSNYYASNKGNIKNSKDLIMKKKISGNGYHVLVLTNKLTDKKHTYLVHRLVAYTFLKNNDPINKKFVNHKDKNRSNCNVENLEWITRTDNNIHAHGYKIKMIDPETNKIIKLFDSVAHANIYLGMAKTSKIISNICKLNNSKLYCGYKWQFDNDNNDNNNYIDNKIYDDEDIFITMNDLLLADRND